MHQTTEAVGIARLKRVAELLMKLQRERFNFEVWVGEDWKGKRDLSCGTTACALGWATTIPSIRRAGLILKPDRNGGGSVTLKEAPRTDPLIAACKIFGITHDEAEYLFTPESFLSQNTIKGGVYPDGPSLTASNKTVAKHILRFLKYRFGDDAR